MDFREVIETTGTCRFYRPDPVPDDVLRRVLDGTRYAPTGGNRQGVRFVAVRDPAKRRHLKELYLPLWEQYASRATARPGAPVPRLLANADHSHATSPRSRCSSSSAPCSAPPQRATRGAVARSLAS